jgi:heat shock protein HtpX
VSARLPQGLLALLGLLLAAGNIAELTSNPGLDAVSWWVIAFLAVDAALMVVLGLALTRDPRPLLARRLLAAAALLWLLVLVGVVVLEVNERTATGATVLLALVAVLLAGGLLALAAGTPAVADRDPGDPLGRVGAVVALAIGLIVAAVVATVVVVVAAGAIDALVTGRDPARLRLGAVVAIVLIPIVTFGLAGIGARRAAGGTFYQQQAANRRNSLLLLVALVGTLAATSELITAAVTVGSVPSLWAAGIAALVGLGAALGADRFGGALVLDIAGARPADPRAERVLLNIVREVAIAAGIPEPRVYVVEDPAPNAFATGRDPEHAAVAVTRGLLDTLDREQLQGVIGHELGHVRNLDTRYALYVAVLVGLVVVVTDGFLRLIVGLWRSGAFNWGGGRGSSSSRLTGLLLGLAVGTFLLVVALLLRLVAPVFSLLVQAAASRQREFLADATSVELTRNPLALERALATIGGDQHRLVRANRGTQHLWFRNPVREGDGWFGLFATHPTIGARIERLRTLRGLAGPNPAFATAGAQASGEAVGPLDPIPAELNAES